MASPAPSAYAESSQDRPQRSVSMRFRQEVQALLRGGVIRQATAMAIRLAHSAGFWRRSFAFSPLQLHGQSRGVGHRQTAHIASTNERGWAFVAGPLA